MSDTDFSKPIPGDVRSEPVATAQQSARPGSNRVGPPTVAQDADADYFTPDGVAQIKPGEEVSAATPFISGAIELPDYEDEYEHDVSEHRASGEKVAARETASATKSPSK